MFLNGTSVILPPKGQVSHFTVNWMKNKEYLESCNGQIKKTFVTLLE